MSGSPILTGCSQYPASSFHQPEELRMLGSLGCWRPRSEPLRLAIINISMELLALSCG